MWEVEENFRVRIGGNTYINTSNILVYSGKSLFTLKRHSDNGYLGIYFEIYDASGQHLASVKRNEIYVGDKNAYKIQGSLNRYVVTERATDQIICDIEKRHEAHPAELDVSVKLYTPSGFFFNASPNQTNMGGITMTGNTFIGGAAAIVIGTEPANGAFFVANS